MCFEITIIAVLRIVDFGCTTARAAGGLCCWSLARRCGGGCPRRSPPGRHGGSGGGGYRKSELDPGDVGSSYGIVVEWMAIVCGRGRHDGGWAFWQGLGRCVVRGRGVLLSLLLQLLLQQLLLLLPLRRGRGWDYNRVVVWGRGEMRRGLGKGLLSGDGRGYAGRRCCNGGVCGSV